MSDEINAKIDQYNQFREAIEMLKKMPTDEERIEAVAILAASFGWESYRSKFLPKGKVYIGTGENIPFDFSKGPQITPPK